MENGKKAKINGFVVNASIIIATVVVATFVFNFFITPALEKVEVCEREIIDTKTRVAVQHVEILRLKDDLNRIEAKIDKLLEVKGQ